MKHLLLFESYFSRLDEIKYDAHWIERTSLRDLQSRIVPYDNDYKFGFELTGFLDSKNNKISLYDGIRLLKIDNTSINKYISKALNILTNSKSLEKWLPDNDKEAQMLDLGRICFYKGDTKLYPIFKGGKGPDKPGFYREGDKVWGLVKSNNVGVTIKYYLSDEEGKDAMYRDSERVSGLKSFAFYNNSAYGYPYKENFELIVDLTEDLELFIVNKLKAQVEGDEWKLGPDQEREIQAREINYANVDYKRIQISKGLIISIVNQETGKKNIYEVDDDPLNTEQMYLNYLGDRENKTDLLKETPVIFRGYLMDKFERYNGGNPSRPSYSKLSSFAKSVTLNPGDKVYIDKAKKGNVLDPNQAFEFKFITAEPSILKRGSAQIALDVVK
jgi:hypothetical protein